MPTTVSEVLKNAASQIGKYFPGKSPYGEDYGNRHGSVYDDAQFCYMGLTWVFKRSGGLDIFPEGAYTPSGVAWFKKKGLWHTGSVNNIKKGDIIFYDFPGLPNRVSHVGIAEKDGANGRVQTIEFNTSGTASGDQRNGRVVARKIRSSYIVGWGRPKYQKPVARPVSNPISTGKKSNSTVLQRAVRTKADNSWGPLTDKHFEALRQASDWGGNDFPHGVKFAQKVVGTEQDNDWGPKSRRAHKATVRQVQTLLNSMGYNPGRIDGEWGPNTERAYKAARKARRV
jgi:hypothetical protein